MKLNRAFDIIKPLIKRWDYQPLDPKYDLDKYSNMGPKEKETLLSDLQTEINTRKIPCKQWEEIGFYFGCLNTATLIGVMLLGMTQINLPKTLCSRKKFSLGPRLKISIGLLSIQSLARQVIKYIGIFYKKPLQAAKERDEAYRRIDQEYFLKFLNTNQKEIK
ncbi:MAG: hypothetical protein KDK60_03730 [Chlamydiia bacterium]|nr:hypothetical protein [Chlamydiia bacterium]